MLDLMLRVFQSLSATRDQADTGTAPGKRLHDCPAQPSAGSRHHHDLTHTAAHDRQSPYARADRLLMQTLGRLGASRAEGHVGHGHVHVAGSYDQVAIELTGAS
jgi:hypothetical protein